MYRSISEEAWALVHAMASDSKTPHGFGTMSPAAYDTAWVAMTQKKDKYGVLRPLIPEAYTYLENTQSEDGSWAADVSTTDGIVNTLAALLALKKRERRQADALRASQNRCIAAVQALRRLLDDWDMGTSDRVGMELLVPNLLRLLEEEGIKFEFRSREALMSLNTAKLARLGSALSSSKPTSLTHSLEAFVGTLDFDSVKRHKMPNGSMLASPSSTAAYLMNATEWDDESEAYLRMVFERQSEAGHKGGFPSAYPSTIFETSWVLNTLLQSGFDKDDFLLADVRSLTTLLETGIKQGQGTVGWAPNCLPDADDTAKTISALHLLGWDQAAEPMIQSFEADACFITYEGERNPSVSANCNVLSCFLQTATPVVHTKQILKCATFITKTWSENSGPDKWHTSARYSTMLQVQAFVRFLKKWSEDEFDVEAIPKNLVYQDVPRMLLDILAHTMNSQKDDGSWESKREVTAYAILTLTPLLSLPWVDFLKPECTACILRGKAYLENHRKEWREAERIWIEKTVYGSPNLSQAYCLAAMKVVVPTTIISAKICDMFPLEMTKKMGKMASFFAKVPPFPSAPNWKLQLSLLQSASYSAALKAHRYSIFPPLMEASDEKYQNYIPFTWIGCKDHLSTPITPKCLWDMMLVSMYNFQVDAFMETSARDCYAGRLNDLKGLICGLFSEDSMGYESMTKYEHATTPKKMTNGVKNGVGNVGQSGRENGIANCNDDYAMESNGENGHTNGLTDQDEHVKKVLTKFVNFALQHPKVLASPAPMRQWLAHELQTFLLAHITHMEDCDSLAFSASSGAKAITWSKPRTTFFKWVRTTSADHTSCPYSFVFYLCLIGNGSNWLEMSIQKRYALEDACRHLAAMCRQYNDLGSVSRDQNEGNLNSVNFPEFSSKYGNVSAASIDTKRQGLLAVAEYESRCLGRVLGELELSMDARLMEKLRLLIQVTDLYGQIYVVRDIGIRREEEGPDRGVMKGVALQWT
ncbi:hypothetical protein HBI81_039160 [Parastagonospora nodorum]|nr:hypothetical protein HBH53_009060 [Parastagonospora nodorum]KAH4058763.1 hypothetical protein HBH49_037330 [Parastagonospora nodorum]KAH4237579.1 hypothetical protein HBI05_123010 [Parastagonospora nodorum]KAH4238412.1 hypothetical protein HBI06_045030 [Parastagonospora nodorum]KAH4419612.1 hypothetical protein HBH92_022870 [Parastagonospora nodorum]